MKRKLWIILLLIGLLSCAVPVCYAAEGSIRIRLEEEGEVRVILVGKPEGDRHRLLNEYGGETVTFDETLSAEVAAALARQTGGGRAQKTEKGVAEFTGLEEGLYLVTHNRWDRGKGFEPFLLILPWDGSEWQVEVTPHSQEIPETGDPLRFSFAVMTAAGILILLLQNLCSEKKTPAGIKLNTGM